ncbi:MAG TPA: hypothetical protein VKF59_00395 [Candidatus Dormibacteraeota bacterium]|nr:hypothetical protein [Candidatus Dormibacteraeota bacterium]
MCRDTHRLVRCIPLIGAGLLGLAVAGCGPVGQLRLPVPVSSAGREPAPSTAVGGATHGRQSDTFMRSVALRDGALGWRQLCPDLQKVVTEKAMRSQADSQRAAEVGRIARLGIDFVGGRSLRGGTQIRFYVLTADMTDGSAASRVYIVRSQPTGCVEDVQVEDEQ